MKTPINQKSKVESVMGSGKIFLIINFLDFSF